MHLICLTCSLTAVCFFTEGSLSACVWVMFVVVFLTECFVFVKWGFVCHPVLGQDRLLGFCMLLGNSIRTNKTPPNQTHTAKSPGGSQRVGCGAALVTAGCGSAKFIYMNTCVCIHVYISLSIHIYIYIYTW